MEWFIDGVDSVDELLFPVPQCREGESEPSFRISAISAPDDAHAEGEPSVSCLDSNGRSDLLGHQDVAFPRFRVAVDTIRATPTSVAEVRIMAFNDRTYWAVLQAIGAGSA